jgi:Protein of unknown function (DUF3987)
MPAPKTLTTLQSSVVELIEVTALSPEAPRPLTRELPAADAFPVEALGDVLGSAAKAINDRVQAPMAICGQSVLATATLAVQGHADIELPTGHVKPISNFMVTVAETGERKTAADNEALRPVKKYEKELRAEYDIKFAEHNDAMIAWEEARKHAVKAAKGNRAAIKLALDKIGPAPTAPLTPMLTCPEPTFEGLIKTLASGRPSMGIFSDEGGQFIGGHGMTDEAKLRTAAGLSSLWDGETIKRVRAADGATILPGRRVAMHVMAQPLVAATMLADPLLLNQGYLSRCLVSAPASRAGTRKWREPLAASTEALRIYDAKILEILERALPLADKQINQLAPPVVMLGTKARALWVAFTDKIETQIGPGGALVPIKGLANKIPEHAARIAAVLAKFTEITAGTISPEFMADGITLAQHYAAEGLRLFECGQISADLILAGKLLDWLAGGWTEDFVSLPDIYQKGPNAIRDKTTAKRLVGILEDHGWMLRAQGGADVAGQYRREAWLIIRPVRE